MQKQNIIIVDDRIRVTIHLGAKTNEFQTNL